MDPLMSLKLTHLEEVGSPGAWPGRGSFSQVLLLSASCDRTQVGFLSQPFHYIVFEPADHGLKLQKLYVSQNEPFLL